MLLFCRTVENIAIAYDHDSTSEVTLIDLPDISDDECVENMTIPVEDMKSKGAASLGIFVNIMLDEIYALNWINNSKFIHYPSTI